MQVRTLNGPGRDPRTVHRIRAGDTMAQVDTLVASGDGAVSFERRSVVLGPAVRDDAGLLAELARTSGAPLAFSDGARSFGLEDPGEAAALSATGIEVDAEVVALLSHLHSYDRSVYEFYRAPGERGAVRRQMARAYPFFAGEVARKIRLKLATDKRESPIAAFSNAYGTSPDGQPLLGKGMLKRFAGRALPDRGVPVQAVIEALTSTQVDWFPRDEREWDWFLVVVDGVHRTLCPATGLAFGDLVAASKGRWEDFVRRASRAADNLAPPLDPEGRPVSGWKPGDEEVRASFLQACQETVGMVRSCRNLLVLPAAARSASDRDPLLDVAKAYGADSVATDMLVAGKTLVAVFETHRAYVHQAAHVETAIKDRAPVTGVCSVEVASDGWPPLTDVHVAPNGLHLVPLTDPRQLKDEGRGWGEGGYGRESEINEDGTRGLNLCVGHYYLQGARQGVDHMISCRRVAPDGTFERVALARFHVKGDFEGIEQQEYKRRENAPVPDGSPEGEAMAWFRQGVADGTIPLNRNGVLTYASTRKKIAETVEAYCGYEWREDGVVEDAVEAWRPFLQKPYADFSFDEMLSCPPIDSLAEELAPSFGKYSPAA